MRAVVLLAGLAMAAVAGCDVYKVEDTNPPPAASATPAATPAPGEAPAPAAASQPPVAPMGDVVQQQTAPPVAQANPYATPPAATNFTQGVPGAAPPATAPSAAQLPAAGQPPIREVAQPGVGVKGDTLEYNVIQAPAKAYFQIREKAAFIQVDHALNLFRGLEGRLPKSHEEFMEKVIQANQIQLPELPAGSRYVWDPEKGELMVERPR